MMMSVRDFNALALDDVDSLVRRLQKQTGRTGQEEAHAWRSSLGFVARCLDDADLGDFHVHLAEHGGDVSLEYRLPASASWCDLVLLGQGETNPAAVVLELKHWDLTGDRPGPRPGLVWHRGELELHPSEQVRGYAEYCRYFHSAVQESGATVAGCTLFTRSNATSPYTSSPHEELTREYPVFGTDATDSRDRLPAFLRRHLRRPDRDFASDFENGRYTQDRGFIRNVASAILEKERPEFVLLDGQARGYERCLETIERVLAAGGNQKAVVLIEGPPGSGKSVLAARLWATLAQDERLTGNVVLVSTSGSQKSNWQRLFENVVNKNAARNIVLPANQYNPGLSPIWVKEQREKGKGVTIESWRANLELFRRLKGNGRIEDDAFTVSIVDEAHALIDPTAPGANGVSPSGWAMHAGPQAWHIIRASRISIFLLDSAQSYRDNETTTSASIRRFAEDHGATLQDTISLADHQFRCAGSKEYVDWVDRLLTRETASTPEPAAQMTFPVTLVDDPGHLDEALRRHREEGSSVRLLSAYGREWKTRDSLRPHALPGRDKDFHIPYVRDGLRTEWSRVWNYAPKQDYTLFIQAPDGSEMHRDSLSEIGCPYVVRGFDWDYIGVLWLSDLVWRDDRWVPQIDHIHESAWKKTLGAAKNEYRSGQQGPATRDLAQRAARGYRILLTRGIKGAYLWCEDEETREHIRGSLAQASKAD